MNGSFVHSQQLSIENMLTNIISTLAIATFLMFPFTGEHENVNFITTKNDGSHMELLVGTYTGKGSEGIYQLDFDIRTGELSNEKLLVQTSNPSYLTQSKERNFVYSVNEGGGGSVSSFNWAEGGDKLMLVSQQSSEGSSPCHVEINPAENLLSVANYSSGNLTVFSLSGSGNIEANPTVFQHEGSGPVKPNQSGPRAHCSKFDPNGKFLYAVDLGIDQIISYPVTEEGVQEPSSQLHLDPGDGPRHFIFHPKLDLAFVVNELGSSVVSMKINHTTGELERIDKASTIPSDFDGKNYCADIHMSSDGRYLYASNRGHHSIAIFEVSGDGTLNRIGIESVRGEWPRNFTLSPDEKYILVANQNTDNITVFNRDANSGLITYTGHEFKLSRPVALLFR